MFKNGKKEVQSDKKLPSLRGGFTDGRVKRVRIANRLSLLLRQQHRRNSMSVEQIQDRANATKQYTLYKIFAGLPRPHFVRPRNDEATCHPAFIAGSHKNPTTALAVITPHPTLSHKGRGKRKVAFTLAEVLITLGIIGIVAAMTLPALIQHHRKIEYSSRLKKFYSSMNQAILLSSVTNGFPSEWDKKSTIYDEDGNWDAEANEKFNYDFFMKYLAPYMKYTKIEQGKKIIDEDGNEKVSSTKVYFSDSTTAVFNNGTCVDINVDVNGKSKPNKYGRDMFVFLICFDEYSNASFCGNNSHYFCSYLGETSNSRGTLLDQCKRDGYYCSGLLMRDGWEFKKDYPYGL